MLLYMFPTACSGGTPPSAKPTPNTGEDRKSDMPSAQRPKRPLSDSSKRRKSNTRAARSGMFSQP